MGQIYEVIVNAENGEGLSENATEQLATPIGSPEAEPLHVKYEIVDEKVCFRDPLSTLEWKNESFLRVIGCHEEKNSQLPYSKLIDDKN